MRSSEISPAIDDRLVRQLAARLSETYGKGFSHPSIKRMKQFYLTFPHGSTMPTDFGVGWTHDQILRAECEPETVR